MLTYMTRRILISIPTLIVITMITFFIIRLAPGDPFAKELNAKARDQAELKQKLRKKYGLDKPLIVQYLKWLTMVLQGDFGTSFKDKRPVLLKILKCLPYTLELNIIAMILVFSIAVPIGIYSAVNRYSTGDKIFTVLAYMGISLPIFWLALLLMTFFGVYLQILPVSGTCDPVMWDYMNPMEKLLDHLKHLILPVCVAASTNIAAISRYVRGKMIEVINQDYIRTARAKGLREEVVILKHAFRNSLIPLITLIGLMLPTLISSSFIFETIFSWPGMGRLGYEAIIGRDYNLIMGTALFGAILTLLGNLLADISYAFADPRIRLQ
ncbi:ABC transporter permease [Candidatus Riflebacteria bacterium]